MNTKRSKAAIHAAARHAGLTRTQYLAAIALVGDRHGLTFNSCLDIPQNMIGEVLDEIQHKQGELKC